MLTPHHSLAPDLGQPRPWKRLDLGTKRQPRGPEHSPGGAAAAIIGTYSTGTAEGTQISDSSMAARIPTTTLLHTPAQAKKILWPHSLHATVLKETYLLLNKGLVKSVSYFETEVPVCQQRSVVIIGFNLHLTGRVASSDWSRGWNMPGPPTSLPGTGFVFLGTKVLHTHGSGGSKPEDKVYPGQPSGGRTSLCRFLLVLKVLSYYESQPSTLICAPQQYNSSVDTTTRDPSHLFIFSGQVIIDISYPVNRSTSISDMIKSPESSQSSKLSLTDLERTGSRLKDTEKEHCIHQLYLAEEFPPLSLSDDLWFLIRPGDEFYPKDENGKWLYHKSNLCATWERVATFTPNEK
eukprot:bmy_07058T0